MTTILIVDDVEQNRYLLKSMLAGSAVEVLEAAHGAEALEVARRQRPDLIISDILMPQMDGFALCRECKRDAQLRDIPFVFYTATYTDPRDEALARQLGAARFIVKGAETEDFVGVLEEVLAAAAAGQLATPPPEIADEPVIHRLYNEALIRKLEEKMLDLDRLNRGLTDSENRYRRLAAETMRRVEQLQALQTIDRAITAGLDLRHALDILLEQTVAQLRVDAAGILLYDAPTLSLVYAAGRGFRGRAYERSQVRLGEGQAGRAALERRTLRAASPDAADAHGAHPSSLAGDDFVASAATPLVAKGQIKGVLEIFHRSSLLVDEDWTSFFEALAQQAAIAIDSTQLFENLQRSNLELSVAYDATIEGWSHAMDLRDKETEGHTLRVTEMTLRLARAAGMSEEELVHVRRGALLHDIGKMGVADAILLKPGKLSAEDWAAMRLHPTFAHEMLSPIAYLRPSLDIPYCHHEHWDGSGYPRGLAGEQIPRAARLFAVVDVWDALTSDRPYRKAWSTEQALAHIRERTGSQFDPWAVELFFRVVASDAS